VLICALSVLHFSCYRDDLDEDEADDLDEEEEEDDEEDPHVTVMIPLVAITAPLLSTTFN
jgi:hypothetical protein